jgi:hypothetical protein
MVQITLSETGPRKSDLVEQAYGYCGLNEFEYERTPEEMTTGLKRLNALLARLAKRGIDLGFTFPTYGNGLLEEPSGIPDDVVEPVCALLAQRLAPALGATLSDDAKAVLATAMQDLYANYASAPPTMLTSARLPSSGVRHRRLIVGTATATATATSPI